MNSDLGDFSMEYVLKNEYLTVKFQTVGGTLSSIKDNDGVEYLWQGDKTYWSGQAPVLFPICGSIRGDKAILKNGKETQMPRHGIVRKKEFICEEQTENSITFAIASNEEMYAQFPFDFKLCIKYSLVKNTIKTEYLVENKGEEIMPFFIGGHPGFNCPLFENEKYEDYTVVFEEKENCSVPTPVTETGLIDVEHRTPFFENENRLNLKHELFAEDAIIFDELKSRSVHLVSKNHNKSIQLYFEQFPYFILWSTANNGPFIAMEPWVGLSTCSDEGDVFEEKRNVQYVEGKSVKNYAFTIAITE